MIPWLLIGNPDNRRVTLFQTALAAQGARLARVWSWLELLRQPDLLLEIADTPHLVRLDSAGENAAVERALLVRGHDAAVAAGVSCIAPDDLARLDEAHGRILCPRQAHLGFSNVLAELEAVLAQRLSWVVLNPPAAIGQLFDKRVTSRRYAELGVPVPRGLGAVKDHAALRARMDEAECRAAYVKLSCGSSASCLAVVHRHGDEDHLMTTVEQTSSGFFNSLRVRRVTEPRRVGAVIDFLLGEGSQVEEAVPKARLDGRFVDLRVLVVDGEPAFTVVRSSTHPITNLHLGGRRGSLEALRAAAGDAALEAGYESCQRVHAASLGAFHVGVDLLFEPRYAGHRVLEANAFGDLLPNLTRDGLSVYEWEIRAAHRRHEN